MRQWLHWNDPFVWFWLTAVFLVAVYTIFPRKPKE